MGAAVTWGPGMTYDTTKLVVKTDHFSRDYDGRTALHLAAAEGHRHCVDFLVVTCGLSPLTSDR